MKHLNFVKSGLWVAVVLFGIRCLFSLPHSVYEYFSFAGEAIATTFIFLTFYENHLWKFNPLSKMPKIYGKFNGKIIYLQKDKKQEKNVLIFIKQTLFSTYVSISTDEILSNTITSEISKENGEYVLYYTYITNPKSQFSIDNPIQYGTCRIPLLDKNILNGTYWTSRKTIGDILLKRAAK
jgi:hypothetical protein